MKVRCRFYDYDDDNDENAGICVFFLIPVKIKIQPVQKNQNCAREKKRWPWKKLKTPEKVPMKKQICPWKFYVNHAREIQKSAREKKKQMSLWKNTNIIWT